jgi:hypothetical protein
MSSKLKIEKNNTFIFLSQIQYNRNSIDVINVNIKKKLKDNKLNNIY